LYEIATEMAVVSYIAIGMFLALLSSITTASAHALLKPVKTSWQFAR